MRIVDWLETMVGGEATYLPVDQAGVKIHVAFWKDKPDPGYGFFASLGLAAARKKHAKAELLLCVNSFDLAWGFAMGFIVAQARDNFSFAIGETINFNARIAAGSEMSAFLIVPQMVFPEEFESVAFSEGQIQFRQLVPIYHAEMLAIEARGPGFFARQLPDVSDVSRPMVAL